MSSSTTMRVQRCLDRINAGDPKAREELITIASNRLRLLAHRMFRKYERVRRWEDTEDVLQNALVRLVRAMEAVTLSKVEDFFKLATVLIRRELLDMVRKYFGPRGMGTNLDSDAHGTYDQKVDRDATTGHSTGPDDLAVWTEFHQQAEKLPENDREVFDLLWYQGLTQDEASQVLGCSTRTIKRRWLNAKVRMGQVLGAEVMDRE